MGVKPGNTNLAIPAGRVVFFLLALLLSHPLLAQQAAVRSDLSASTITRDESVTLTVTALGVDGELDASALEEDFDVVGQSSSRQVRTVVDGSNQPVTISIVTWTLELLPRDVGIFTVPAVTVGGVSSQLLSLTVNDIPAGARRDIFVEASVDSRTPWVQSQVLMTVKVFQAIEIVEGGLSDPTGEQLQVQRIGKDTQATEVRDGREYRVTERRFALFPQKSGAVSIDPVVLSVSVPTNATATLGFFSPTRKLTRRSDAITLDVQARPSSGAAWWLPASALQLDGQWSGDVSKAVVDQPLTRTIILRAGGVLESQLPDIRIPEIEGVSLYAEEPVRAMGMNERGLVAEQTIKWALIPQREGELVLPELSLEWFNTDTGQVEVSVLPEERIVVGPSAAATANLATPDAGASANAGPSGGEQGASGQEAAVAPRDAASDTASLEQNDAGLPGSDESVGVAGSALSTDATLAKDRDPNATSGQGTADVASGQLASDVSSLPGEAVGEWFTRPWRLATMILLGLWIASLGAFWWWRRRLLRLHDNDSADDSQRASTMRQRARQTYQKLAPLAEVEACCKSGDAAALRSALIAWAGRQWPQQPPRTLTDLSQRLSEGPARQSLAALDAALYSRAPAQEDRDALTKRMHTLPAELSAALSGGGQSDDEHSQSAAEHRRQGNGLPAL